MEMRVTVSQAVHANGILMKKILGAHCRRESAPGTAEQEVYELLVLHRQQEEGGGGAAALRGTESAVLALLA
jgi:hypothetical protein